MPRKKSPGTRPGVDPGTFGLVAQRSYIYYPSNITILLILPTYFNYVLHIMLTIIVIISLNSINHILNDMNYFCEIGDERSTQHMKFMFRNFNLECHNSPTVGTLHGIL
jgi:hypothetical protein